MKNKTVILFEHFFENGKITIGEVECIEKPKTYCNTDETYFKASSRKALSKNELDVLLRISYSGDGGSFAMYSTSREFENFKTMLEAHVRHDIDKNLRWAEQSLETAKQYQAVLEVIKNITEEK
jgi:hypothetical protein